MKRWYSLLRAYMCAYWGSWASLFERDGLATLIVLTRYRGRRTVHIETGFWRVNSVGFGSDWVTYQVYFSEKFNRETNTWEQQ